MLLKNNIILKSEKHWWFGLICILLVGLILRLWGLSEQGLFYYDEAWYRLVAQTMMQLPDWINLIQNGMTPQQAFEKIFHWGFYPHLCFKPFYIILLIIANIVFGLFNPISGAVISVLAGLIIIITSGYLIRHFTNSIGWGLIGAFLIAVSGLEVLYSRLSLPHQVGASVLLLYCWLYVCRLHKIDYNDSQSFLYTLAIGIALGSLLAFHDLFLPIVILLWGIEGLTISIQHWPAIQKIKLKQPLTRFSIFTTGLLLPLVSCEVAVVFLRKLFHRTLHKGYVLPYHQELFNHVSIHPVSAERIAKKSDYGYFLKVFTETESTIFIAIVLLGFFLGIWQCLKCCHQHKKFASLLFVIMFSAISFALITAYPSKIIRLGIPFLPLFYLTATLGLFYLHQNFKLWHLSLKYILTLLLLTLMAVPSVSFCIQIIPQLKSGFPKAAAVIKGELRPNERLATTYNYPQYIFYMQKPVIIVRDFIEILSQEKKYNIQVRYFSFDFENVNKLCSHPEKNTSIPGVCHRLSRRKYLSQMEKGLKNNITYTVKNPMRRLLIILLNSHHQYGDLQTLQQNADKIALDKIRIYKIKRNTET